MHRQLYCETIMDIQRGTSISAAGARDAGISPPPRLTVCPYNPHTPPPPPSPPRTEQEPVADPEPDRPFTPASDTPVRVFVVIVNTAASPEEDVLELFVVSLDFECPVSLLLWLLVPPDGRGGGGSGAARALPASRSCSPDARVRRCNTMCTRVSRVNGSGGVWGVGEGGQALRLIASSTSPTVYE